MLWAYCHVPNGSTADMTARIENQIERFAPGFRDCIVARHAMAPAEMERRNANLVGGDIGGGACDISQLFMRPVFSLNPYATADRRRVPLLVVDAAGDRRPRHVRPLRRAGRAEQDGFSQNGMSE